MWCNNMWYTLLLLGGWPYCYRKSSHCPMCFVSGILYLPMKIVLTFSFISAVPWSCKCYLWGHDSGFYGQWVVCVVVLGEVGKNFLCFKLNVRLRFKIILKTFDFWHTVLIVLWLKFCDFTDCWGTDFSVEIFQPMWNCCRCVKWLDRLTVKVPRYLRLSALCEQTFFTPFISAWFSFVIAANWCVLRSIFI